MSVDLYKFYLDIVVKVLVGCFAVISAVLSFYFAQASRPLARWALVMPAVLSFALALLWLGARRWNVVRDDAVVIANELQLKNAFERRFLGVVLNGSAILLFCAGFALAALVIINP